MSLFFFYSCHVILLVFHLVTISFPFVFFSIPFPYVYHKPITMYITNLSPPFSLILMLHEPYKV